MKFHYIFPVIFISLLLFSCAEEKDPIAPASEIVTWEERKVELTQELEKITDIEKKVIFLREYVHHAALRGEHTFNVGTKVQDPNMMDAAGWHEVVINDAYTLYPTDIVSFLVAVYKEFGLLAFYYAEGTPENSFGQVIVRYYNDIGAIYTMMDPVFNIHYADPDGGLLDIRTYLRMMDRRTGRDSVIVVENPAPVRYLQEHNVPYDGFCCYDGSRATGVSHSHHPTHKYIANAPFPLMYFMEKGNRDQFVQMATYKGYNVPFKTLADYKWMPILKRRIYGDKAHLLEASLNQIIFKDTIEELEEMEFEVTETVETN